MGGWVKVLIMTSIKRREIKGVDLVFFISYGQDNKTLSWWKILENNWHLVSYKKIKNKKKDISPNIVLE